jgi:Na+/proline symporter/signal transduction histidine kinase
LLPGWMIFGTAFAYILLLFAVATYGDRRARRAADPKKGRPIVYALSLAIYCTSWTYFGAVGQAAESGFEFLGIYTGPILLFTLGMPLLRRIVSLAKTERLTSVADFVAARYGKSSTVAALVAVIALVGAIPYIALQLKAVTASVALLMNEPIDSAGVTSYEVLDLSFVLTLLMACFAIVFGTRHTNATEHQDGLILAISTESLVKLIALCTAGIYITFYLFSGPVDLWQKVSLDPAVQASLGHETSIARWIVLTALSGCAIILLPRQFHVAVVENRTSTELKTAGYLLPLYLILINIFVMPIAFAGLTLLGPDSPPDLFVLSLPITLDLTFLSILVFLGGFSAATAMVIVASVALAIMISNDFVMPLLLRRSIRHSKQQSRDFSQIILNVRRISILGVLALGYGYHSLSDSSSGLASIGLLAFSAIAQIAPPLIGGLIWHNANARGAIIGLALGSLSWVVLLLLPSMGGGQYGYLAADFFAALFPDSPLFSGDNPDLLVASVLFCLLVNCAGFILGSLTRQPNTVELMQAAIFVRRPQRTIVGKDQNKASPSIGDIKTVVARYVPAADLEQALKGFERQNGRYLEDKHPADMQFIRFCEQMLGSSIGASSARLVLSLTLQRAKNTSSETTWLLDQASEALIQNQDMLQAALAQMDQGIAVFDNYYELMIWNRQFGVLMDLPDSVVQIGLPLQDIIRTLEERGDLQAADHSQTVSDFLTLDRTFTLVLDHGRRIVEIRSNAMHGKGIVATFTDVSSRVASDNALKQANETLEQRVDQRTAELIRVNKELAEARGAAEEANLGKTRFFAAAGHDILQPLNAARLYSSALVEQETSAETKRLARNIDSSLESVETILGAVLDISRLDTGAMRPRLQPIPLNEFLRKIETDFIPAADEKRLKLVFLQTSAVVVSDPNLLRRLLQNLISNAIKYTSSGKVVVGVRPYGQDVIVQVSDSGIGIPDNMHRAVFKEFARLDEGARAASGLGLGLSIVDRLAKVLNHRVKLRSNHGKGTTFTVQVPRATQTTTDVQWSNTPEMGVIKNQLEGLRVACIDNEPRILEGMALLLKGWKCELTTYGSITHIQKSLASKTIAPDVIIADYHLGDGNGIDGILLIRRHFMRSIPAVLITADRSLEVRSTAERLKIGILHKPIKPAALRAYMNQMASGKQSIN